MPVGWVHLGLVDLQALDKEGSDPNMSRATKPVQMAFLKVGFQYMLLPADKAMKVVECLQGAVQAEIQFNGHREQYEVQEGPLRIELSLVSQSQITMPHGEPFPSPTAKPTLPLSRPRLPR
jgi:hypothetical protein